jgi:phenylalanyl-tRNA synthetase beta chain
MPSHAIACRYDILCLEGMARALNVFLGNSQPPVYKMLTPLTGAPLQVMLPTNCPP